MMQFASKGQWGRGLYFAEEAGYSHFYATKGASPPPGRDDLPHDECEFMLASLLLGDVVEVRFLTEIWDDFRRFLDEIWLF